MQSPLRLAWTGPIGEGGGVPGMGTLMLVSLLQRGLEVDLYFGGPDTHLPQALQGQDGLRVIRHDSGWRWNRWYSRHPVAAFLTSSPARMWAHSVLSVLLWREHRRRAYDCIFQLSQPELLLLGVLRPWLPPTVVHPCSHAAGELRWHRRESGYAKSLEPRWLHLLARTFLAIRAKMQVRSFRKPDVIVGPSQRFLDLVAQDYDVAADRLRLLRHPVELRPIAREATSREPERVLEVLYVSRISSRKGVELIVSLSHRLRDLAGQVHITIVGGHTQWSDYRAALDKLDPRMATYAGAISFSEVRAMYLQADLLLVPSRYEPGSLVACEALASGLPVIASDQVGPTEVVSAKCMRTFPDGDCDAFEDELRRMLPELRTAFAELSRSARTEAERWFAPSVIADQLEAVLRAAAGTSERHSPRRHPTADQHHGDPSPV